MREIKFRAWVRFLQRTSLVKELIVESGSVLVDDYPYMIEYDAVDLMQFTGLKDVNGTEIYEGDIIEWEGIRSFVVYSIDGFSFNGYMKGADKLRVAVYSDIGYGNGVVIGNIHQNPELLE